MKDADNGAESPRESLPRLLSDWHEAFSSVITELETARARLKELEQNADRQSDQQEALSNKDVEIERLTFKLASNEELILALRRQLGAMDNLEAESKLKDQKITLLGVEHLEAVQAAAAKISDLEGSLKHKLDLIASLEASLRRHGNTMVKFQKDLSTLRQRYAELRSTDQAATEENRQASGRSSAVPGSVRSDEIDHEETHILEAENYLKTKAIDMREPMLQAQRAVIESRRTSWQKKR